MDAAPTTYSSRDKSRNPSLDGLRGLAILLVVWFHSTCWLGLPAATILDKVNHRMAEWGVFGVQMFFVISGYLISNALIRARRQRDYFLAFYTKRFFRIVPLYVVYLTLCLHIAPAFFAIPDISRFQTGEWSFWTFVCNYWQSAVNAPGSFFFSHLWSLSVEEQFYAVAPLFFYLLPPRYWLPSLFLMVTASQMSGITSTYYIPHEEWLTQNNLVTLGLGSILAVLMNMSRVVSPAITCAATAFGLLSCCAVAIGRIKGIGQLSPSVSFSLAVVGVGLMTFGCVSTCLTAPTSIISRVLRWRPLQEFGRYCYCVYLFHFPIVYVLSRLFVRAVSLPSWQMELLCTVITATISLALAALSYRFFESKLLDFGRQLAERSFLQPAMVK